MQSNDFFFIYNIFNKIIKKKKENATVTPLWTHNSVMASQFQTTHMFYLSRNFGNCVEQNKTNIILSFTNASLIQIESSVN